MRKGLLDADDCVIEVLGGEKDMGRAEFRKTKTTGGRPCR